MPNIIKSWQDFATVEDWITNTQVAESGVTQSRVADLNDWIIQPELGSKQFMQNEHSGANVHLFLIEMLEKR